MGFMKAWSVARAKWYGVQLDADDNLKVTGISAANVGAVNTTAIVVNSTVATKNAPAVWGDTWEDTIDVNAALTRNGTRGFIANDGPGVLYVGISSDGTTMATNGADGTTDTPIYVRPGEILDLMMVGVTIDTIKIDADTSATAYRLAVS